MKRFWDKVDIGGPNQCWFWKSAKTSRGYGAFFIDSRIVNAHRMAWELANKSDIPGGMVIRHKCDVCSCVNPAHLEIGTSADNSMDMVERKRSPAGDKNGAAALSEIDAKFIKFWLRRGFVGSHIAEAFSVCKGMIYHIKHGRNWNHI